MSTKETLKQGGYKHIQTCGNGQHILKDLETGNSEVWVCCKNHASYGLIYKNTHLEFASSLPF